MLDDLRELYQEVILDHGKSPRNFRDVEDATAHAHGANPLCGDQLVVYLKLDDGKRIEDVSFVGKGCAISVASASMMTELVKGRTVDDALNIKNTEIVEELSLPPVKIHCSVLAEDSIRHAIADYKKKNEGSGSSSAEASASQNTH